MLEYDDKFKTKFIAPDYKGEYDTKINFKLKINQTFVKAAKDAEVNSEVNRETQESHKDNEFARDYITHIFGTHTSSIESIGFKTAFGRMYYCGKPNKGRVFLVGTTKSKFHFLKFGMESKLNCIGFKFVPSLNNPSVNRKFITLKEDQFEKVFQDEEILAKIPEGKKKDLMIKTLLQTEKDMAFLEEEDENEIGGDDIEDCIHLAQEDNEGYESDENDKEKEHERDKLFNKLVEELKNSKLKKFLMDKKKQEDASKLKKNVTLPVKVDDKKIAEPEQKIVESTEMDKIKKFNSEQGIIQSLIENPEALEVFIEKYAKYIRDEISNQINLREKIDSLKNNFYVKYLNRKKEVKDWEIYENQLDVSEDPFELQKLIQEIIKKAEEKFEDSDIPEEKYNISSTKTEAILGVKAKWKKMASFLNRKYVLIYLRESLLNLAKNILKSKEFDDDSITNLNLKDKVSLFKHSIIGQTKMLLTSFLH